MKNVNLILKALVQLILHSGYIIFQEPMYAYDLRISLWGISGAFQFGVRGKRNDAQIILKIFNYFKLSF